LEIQGGKIDIWGFCIGFFAVLYHQNAQKGLNIFSIFSVIFLIFYYKTYSGDDKNCLKSTHKTSPSEFLNGPIHWQWW